MRRWTSVVFLMLAAAGVSPAYYHFLRYANRDGKLVGLPRKFDLNALPNKTVSYFITGETPEKLADGDSLNSLVSQIQLAARQWNDIDTSDLRLQFGGYSPSRDGQNTPGIDIVFAEVPPGLIAYGGPDIPAPDSPLLSQDGSFNLILRSKVILPKDMSPYPSFKESIFLTIVHEMGHALGLQHTLTSSVMATDVTRAQTKAHALGADDVAGVSLLYPTRTFKSSLGSITGQVTSGGSGVPLASVVAISPNGPAISMLTAPDGTYRIDGIRPGKYYVYTQPLPPALPGEVSPANIQLPYGVDGTPIQPAAQFDLKFYPGVRDQMQATSIPVTAGAVVDGINFDVAPRQDPLHLYNVLSYSFPAQVAVRPAQVNVNGKRNFFVATGTGLMADGQPIAGLQASVLGGTTQITGIKAYTQDYLQFDLGYTENSGDGRRHVVFSTGSDVYVQPGALTLTTKQPPQITDIVSGDGGVLQMTGTDLSANTIVLFDGVPAVSRSYDTESGKLTVTAPSAQNGLQAKVVALNPDGQSSLFIDGDAPKSIALSGADQPSISLNPMSLPAGSESAIEIQGVNTNFIDGLVSLGFGTTDIVVKKLWVVSPTKLIAAVRVAANATQSASNVTVVSGLQRIGIGSGFSVTGADAGRPSITFSSINPLTGVANSQAGNMILALTGNSSGAPIFTIADRTAPFQYLAPGIYGVTIPGELQPGPAILRFQAGSASALPLTIDIDPPAPQITKVLSPQGISFETVNPAHMGDSIVLQLSSPIVVSQVKKPRVVVTVGGVDHVASLQSQGNTVNFSLLPLVPDGPQPATVFVDGRIIGSITIPVRQQAVN